MLGPLDQRTRRSRCSTCSKRRIKCSGGFPCDYCVRTSKTCIPPPSGPTTKAVFAVPRTVKSPVITKPPSAPSVPNTVALDPTTQTLTHFFTNFLRTNDFSGRFAVDFPILTDLYTQSDGLYNATIAVASMDACKKSLVASNSTHMERKQTKIEAFNAYRKALEAQKSEIMKLGTAKGDETTAMSVLWTTLLLGVFELMHDRTGNGWIRHIFHGMSRIIQMRGPDAHITGPGRSFFLTSRVFELSRALITSSQTFLAEPAWKDLLNRIWAEDSSDWHPKESLFDIIADVVTLSQDTRGSFTDGEPDLAYLFALANRGVAIQEALHDWYSQYLIWHSLQLSSSASTNVDSSSSAKASSTSTDGFTARISDPAPHFDPLSATNNPFPTDTASVLSLLYYHSILILLSGIFDYRASYHLFPTATPTLLFQDVQNHVSAIIHLVTLSLFGATTSSTPNQNPESSISNSTILLSPILLFLPLRVAGARAVSSAQKSQILALLTQINQRSFVVAEAFSDDLQGLWDVKKVADEAPLRAVAETGHADMYSWAWVRKKPRVEGEGGGMAEEKKMRMELGVKWGRREKSMLEGRENGSLEEEERDMEWGVKWLKPKITPPWARVNGPIEVDKEGVDTADGMQWNEHAADSGQDFDAQGEVANSYGYNGGTVPESGFGFGLVARSTTDGKDSGINFDAQGETAGYHGYNMGTVPESGFGFGLAAKRAIDGR